MNQPGETDEQLRARCQARIRGAESRPPTLTVAGLVCEVEEWSVDVHEPPSDGGPVVRYHTGGCVADIQVIVRDEGKRRMLSAMACLRDGFGAATFTLVLDALGCRVAADVAWFMHTEQPGGVFRFKALEPDVMVGDPFVASATTWLRPSHAVLPPSVLPEPEPAAPKSTVCPCGIHRADCEYHR